MPTDRSEISDSATDMTITYQSSMSDNSVLEGSQAESYKDRIIDVEREDVRLVDLPKKLIDVGEVIGQGGMGVVRIAHQHLPERDVAVKRLHFAKARLAKALLDEAMIMGGLEHPNIVPVHLVRLTEDNSPEVVMKYIQGSSWNDLLDKTPQTGNGLLEAIDVLRSVCRAVEFAHSRGVIHRDIKPHNIMLGRFGEVYLMDWGIAIRTANIESVPDGLVGTPGYLAPEMLSGIASDVTFQTDIFLLGATLHAILTGQRRHKANNVVAALDAAVKAKPYSYLPEVPPALADLANRACAKNPDDRFSSAADFRTALEKYLSLREAYMVRDRGIDYANEFKSLVHSTLKHKPDGIRIRQRFAEARFGLEQALQMSPDCDGVLPELQQLLHSMIIWLLSNSHIDEAEHLILSMPELDANLVTLVDDRRKQATRNAAEFNYLKQVAPAFDPNMNKLGRIIFGVSIITIVTASVISVLIHDALNPSEISPLRLLFTTGTVALLICTALILSKRLLFTTNLGSRLGHTIVLGFCAAPMFALASLKAGYSGNAIMIGDTLFVALAMASAYPVIRSGRIAAIIAVGNVGVATFIPDWAHSGFMLSTAFSAVCIAYDWTIRDQSSK